MLMMHPSKSTSTAAQRNTKCKDLRFQLPKFRLGRCFTLFLLQSPMYSAVNERSY